MSDTVVRITKSKPERLSISIPIPQKEALEAMSIETGVSQNDLIKQAIAILNASFEAKKRGLDLSLSKNDEVVTTLLTVV